MKLVDRATGLSTLTEFVRDAPMVHRAETEKETADTTRVLWKIDKDLVSFLATAVSPGAHTVETGCGVSTLIFLHRGAQHCCVTPSADEIEMVARYAREHGIGVPETTFRLGDSVDVLPSLAARDFDVALIDGKHAFPWPVIDWFYLAERLKPGGTMVVDDVNLLGVQVVSEFLKHDTVRWTVLRSTEHWAAFRKNGQDLRAVAWNEQDLSHLERPPFKQLLKAKIREKLGLNRSA
jgi:predicted O-methyltransferase YrrM